MRTIYPNEDSGRTYNVDSRAPPRSKKNFQEFDQKRNCSIANLFVIAIVNFQKFDGGFSKFLGKDMRKIKNYIEVESSISRSLDARGYLRLFHKFSPSYLKIS